MKRRASQLIPDQEPEFNARHLEDFDNPDNCPIVFYAANRLAERYTTVEHVFEFNALFRGLLTYVTCSRAQRAQYVGRCQCSGRGPRCEAEYFYILTCRYASLRSGVPYSLSPVPHTSFNPLIRATRVAFRPIFVFDFMYRCGLIGEEMADSLITQLYQGHPETARIVLDLLRKRVRRVDARDHLVNGGWLFRSVRVEFLAAVGQLLQRGSDCVRFLEMAASRNYPRFYILKALEGVLRTGLTDDGKRWLLRWCISHGFTEDRIVVCLKRSFRRFSGSCTPQSSLVTDGSTEHRLTSVQLSPALVDSLMQIGPEWSWPILRDGPLRDRLIALGGKGLTAALGALYKSADRNWDLYAIDILQTFNLAMRNLVHRFAGGLIRACYIEHAFHRDPIVHEPGAALLCAVESWHPEIRPDIELFKLNP